MKKSNKRAFTLIELLIVVGIIGVLAGLLYPAMSKFASTGPKVKSMNNARQIAQAWMNYVKMGQRQHIVSKPDVWQWAAVLAEKADLNLPEMWILSNDPKVLAKLDGENAAMPVNVAKKVGNNWSLDPEFNKFPVSWSVANAVLANAEATVPLLWTRGLKPSGMWDEENGVFGTDGGHIAFADGHVEWYTSLRDENTKQGVLHVYKQTQRTYNISQAIKGGSQNILNP